MQGQGSELHTVAGVVAVQAGYVAGKAVVAASRLVVVVAATASAAHAARQESVRGLAAWGFEKGSGSCCLCWSTQLNLLVLALLLLYNTAITRPEYLYVWVVLARVFPATCRLWRKFGQSKILPLQLARESGQVRREVLASS